MPIKLNTASGGGVTLSAANTATDKTITVPAVDAAMLTDSAGVLNIGSGQVYKDASGNVGIGTSSPSERLQVAGSIRVTSNANDFNVFGGQLDFATNATRICSYTNTGGVIQFFTNLSGGNVEVRAFIDTSGNFAIPTSYNHTTASGANVFIRSDGYLQRSTSALKYKQDIRDYSGIDINALRPVLYKSKCEGDDQTKDHLGIVADEAHEAGITELVTYGAEGEVEGFQYERLTVVLLKAMQEQQQMIETLQAKVAALEAQ